MAEEERLREHEQVLLQLLDEMGRTLVRQERLMEEIEGRHAQMRTLWVQHGAEEPAGQPGQDALVDELHWELERRREQELELHRILDVLKHRCGLEDRVLEELEPYLADEERDELMHELQTDFGRRDRLIEDVEFTSFEVKRDRTSEVIRLLRELEERLSRVVERHLVLLHRLGS